MSLHEPIHALKHFSLIDYIGIGEGERTLTEWLINIADRRTIEIMREFDGLASATRIRPDRHRRNRRAKVH